jgi:hypothetical protein
MPCRITRRTEWKTRLILEYRYNNNIGSFVTLTYSPEFLPESDKFSGGTLVKSHLRNFIKSVRNQFRNSESRVFSYFAVGEYGSLSKRAHYHLCIFGIEHGLLSKIVKKVWKYGFSSVSDLQVGGFERMGYTVGYTVKKMTNTESVGKLIGDDRLPEFSFMSRKPALGVPILPAFVNRLKKYNFYPVSGVSSEIQYYMKRFYPKLKPWPGYFKQRGVFLKLDSFLQSKLFALMYPEVIEEMEIDDEKFNFDYFQSLKNYNMNKAYFSEKDNLIFMLGDDYVKAKEKSEKAERRYKKHLQKGDKL